MPNDFGSVVAVSDVRAVFGDVTVLVAGNRFVLATGVVGKCGGDSMVTVSNGRGVFGNVAVAAKPWLLVLAEGKSVGSSMVTASDVRTVFDVRVSCDDVFSVVGSDASLVVTGDGWMVLNIGDPWLVLVIGDPWLVLVIGDPWLVLVIGDVGGCGGKVSGGQARLLPQKDTSPRCTQSEPGDRKNCKVNTGTVVLYGKHNLTRESQEVVVRL